MAGDFNLRPAASDPGFFRIGFQNTEHPTAFVNKRKDKEQSWQAALQLTGHLLRLDPGIQEARDMRIQALTALAGMEQNPNARHTYLTEALEIRDRFVAGETARPSAASIQQFPLAGFFRFPGRQPRPGEKR